MGFCGHGHGHGHRHKVANRYGDLMGVLDCTKMGSQRTYQYGAPIWGPIWDIIGQYVLLDMWASPYEINVGFHGHGHKIGILYGSNMGI